MMHSIHFTDGDGAFGQVVKNHSDNERKPVSTIPRAILSN